MVDLNNAGKRLNDLTRRRAVARPAAKAAESANKPADASDRPAWVKGMFDFIKQTTSMAQAIEVADRVKAAKDVSLGTATKYKRGAATRLDLDRDDGGDLMANVSHRSFHPIKAAILHCAALSYAGERKACDEAQRSGDWQAAATAAKRARRALIAIQKVQEAERPEATAQTASKRRTLPRNQSWQRVAYEASTPAQKAAVALLWAAGPRPAEIAKGVDVEHGVWQGKAVLLVTIPGAKVSKKLQAGQPVRRMLIDADSDAGQALIECLGSEKKMTVKRGADRLRKDFADIRDRTMLKVSPYSMRHQFAANAKSFAEAEEVAKMMGHQSERSQQRYGSVQQAQKNGAVVLAAQATLPVRPKSDPGIGPRKAAGGGLKPTT